MSNPLCMCCFDPKRPPVLVTRHLSICPWCVNVFNQNKVSVQRLQLDARARLHTQRGTAAVDRHIGALEAQRTPAPVRPALPDDLFKDMAMFRANTEEGRLLGLYRTLVDGRKRRERARAIEHELRTVDVKVRLMRAYWRGLVNFDGRGIARLAGPESDTLRAKVHHRDRGRCILCASTANLHVHHVVALQTCGTNHIANLVTLCVDCHDKQHSFAIGRGGRHGYGSYQ